MAPIRPVANQQPSADEEETEIPGRRRPPTAIMRSAPAAQWPAAQWPAATIIISC
jgi:hypothetical protein